MLFLDFLCNYYNEICRKWFIIIIIIYTYIHVIRGRLLDVPWSGLFSKPRFVRNYYFTYTLIVIIMNTTQIKFSRATIYFVLLAPMVVFTLSFHRRHTFACNKCYFVRTMKAPTQQSWLFTRILQLCTHFEYLFKSSWLHIQW